MINILVPCAGSGRRFADAGYSLPKPLIPVLGVPMVVAACRSLLDEPFGDEHRFVFVARNEHVRDHALADVLWSNFPGCHVLPIDYETDGAARTCLAARHLIDTEDRLLVANCDQLVAGGVAALVRTAADAAILTMPGDGTDRWSYYFVNDEGMAEVVEKRAVSDRATCGVYYWRRGKDFVAAVDEMMRWDDRTNDEFYVAPAFNYTDVSVAEVRIEDTGAGFFGLGTPEDLEAFLKVVEGK